jgi:hypothetical protein
MASLEGVNARHIAALRFGAHAATLALVTGLGLFVVGGTRGAGSWLAFSVATASVLLLVGIWGRFALRRGHTHAEPEADPVALTATPSRPVRSLELTKEHDGSFGSDVDYLMALRHEFRTPLNAVLGFSDVLLGEIDGAVNASQREDLEIIRASGIRLRILLDSALDLSQLVERELRLELERVDVCELVRRVAVEAGQLWSNKRAVHCSLPGAPCVAAVDEARLRRSFLVLADFLATSHRDADVSIDLAVSDGHLTIEIKAQPSDGALLDALPTPTEILVAEDVAKIRRWPVAVTSEIITLHGGSLYHGSGPSRFLVRLRREGGR